MTHKIPLVNAVGVKAKTVSSPILGGSAKAETKKESPKT